MNRRREAGCPGPCRPSGASMPNGFREPEMHRWPPTADSVPPPPQQSLDQQFFRCSLSYQNQTLAEIKTLLERLALAAEERERSHKK